MSLHASERDPWWTWPSRTAGMLFLLGALLLPLAAMWKRSVQAQARQEIVGRRVLRPRMILLPKGGFRMGSEDAYTEFPDEHPIHEVHIEQAFALSQTEVTQAQYLAVMGTNPSNFRDRSDWENLPVENVSWLDAAAYCNKLSELEDLPRCYRIQTNEVTWQDHSCTGYRLPTEAEWEYAARADESTRYAGSDNLDEVGWYNENSTHAVATKKPNAWYLYDLTGNVWEWVWDWYEEKYYSQSPKKDPLGPRIGMYRVERGGAWAEEAKDARVTIRHKDLPNYPLLYTGIRLARSYP